MNVTHLRVNHVENPMSITENPETDKPTASCTDYGNQKCMTDKNPETDKPTASCADYGNQKCMTDKNPEFSWRIESDKQGCRQASYRIRIDDGYKIVFDSGEIISDECSFIKCDFSLKEKTIYTWTVTVVDNYGEISSESATFETAFLSYRDIDASWIESPFERNEEKANTFGIENPAVNFHKKFTLNKDIKKARLYASCYGVYRPFIDGKRIDDREMAPEFTPYGKRLYYQTYDITRFLSPGENFIDLTAANGWFFCKQTMSSTPETHDAPAVIFEIDVEYEDGTVQKICSDGTESVRQTNIIYSDLFMGEKHDYTLSCSETRTAIVKNYDKKCLVAQVLPPVKAVEVIPAERVYRSKKDEWIVDFGQVISGRVRVKLNEKKGTVVTLEHSEAKNLDGTFFPMLSTIKQTDTVVCDGKKREFEPWFTFHGFRYVRVTGIDEPKLKDFTAVLLSTEKENCGTFECSDERFNRLYKNIRYSQKNNMCSVPTDCPSREKAGWTGDIAIYGETAMLGEEMTPFLTSWLEGLICDQKESGVVPYTSPYTCHYERAARENMKPYGSSEETGTLGWSDAIVIVPYQMYRVTGNKLILEKCYEPMEKWCDYLIRTMENERGSDLPVEIDKYLFNTCFQFGEWLVPGVEGEDFAIARITSKYTSPFYCYHTMDLMAQVSDALGRDSAKYIFYKGKIKEAIQGGIFENDLLPEGFMGAYVLAFAFDLVNDKFYDEYKNRLVSLLEKNGFCLQTGFLATPFILDALDKIGRHDLALRLLLQDKKPSWLYEVNMGATTIWENWFAVGEDGTPIKTSFDHYAFGVVDSYIFHKICGITSEDAGYNKIRIEPDEKFFDSFTRSFICQKGKIAVEKMQDRLTVTIPPGVTATVVWKGSRAKISSGTYHF